jgi:hypothetical protein
MRRLNLIAVLVVLMLSGLVIQRAEAQTGGPPTAPAPGQSGNQRGVGASPKALTSFALSNPYCYQPDPAVNLCRLNVRYWQATDNGTTSPFLSAVHMSVDNKLRFRATAFFENSISYDYSFVPGGFQVPCGTPNQGGAGNAYGLVYSLMVEPIDTSDASMSTDVASVRCPAFAP